MNQRKDVVSRPSGGSNPTHSFLRSSNRPAKWDLSTVIKMKTSTSATATTYTGESSSRTNREVSACIESFCNDTKESIKEMNTEDDQRCYESNVWGDIIRDEINSLLGPVLPVGYCSINEDRPNSRTKISKCKLRKARLKEKFQGNGKGLVTKFFRVLRKLGKKYKKMAKKLTKYAKDGIENKNIDWKCVARLIFLIVLIAVLIGAVIAFFVSPSTALLAMPFAALILAFLASFQNWYEYQFKEDAKKNHGEVESDSSALIKQDEKSGDFEAFAKAEIENIKKEMENFTEASVRQLADGFKRILEEGRKVIEDTMKEDKNKSN